MSSWGQVALAVVGAVLGAVTGVGAIYGFGLGMALGGVLFAKPLAEQDKPKPAELQMQTSNYGGVVPVLFGTRKLAGNCLYYGNFQTHEQEEDGGGGGKGGPKQPAYTTYTYSVTLVWGLFIGPGTVLRGWAGKDPVDLAQCIIYDGTQTAPDAHLQACLAAEGKTRFPVWKNLVYIVMPNYNLGNAAYVPQFTWEGQSDATFQGTSNLTYRAEGAPNETDYRSDGCIAAGRRWLFSGTHFVGSTEQPMIHRHAKRTLDYVDSTPVDILAVGGGTYDFKKIYGVVAAKNGTIAALVKNADNHLWVVQFTELLSPVWACDLGWQYYEPVYGIADNVLYVAHPDGSELDTVVDRVDLANSVRISETFPDCMPWLIAGTPAGGCVLSCNNNRLLRLDNNLAQLWNIAITSEFVFAADNEHCYGARYYNQDILKRRLSDGAVVATCAPFPNQPFYNYDRAYASDKWHLYVAGLSSEHEGTLQLAQIRKSDMTNTGLVTIGASMSGRCNPATDGSNVFVWLGTEENPGIAAPFVRQYATGVYALGNGTDCYPTAITRAILTNGLYGSDFDSDLLDDDAYYATETWCDDADLLCSLIFDSQITVTDALQGIIGHHNGYIKYTGGLIAHCQLKQETPAGFIAATDLVRTERTLPIKVSRKGPKDLYNSVVVEYLKRDKDYVTGTVICDDGVEIGRSGRKQNTARFDGLMEYNRASRMGNMLLKKELLNPHRYAFRLGLKSYGIAPGDVRTITEPGVELSSRKIRIVNISEGEDYTIPVAAEEECDSIHRALVVGTDASTQPELPDLYGDPGSVTNVVAAEVPACYLPNLAGALIVSYSKPSNKAWAGASLWRSFDGTGNFTRLSTANAGGVAGVVSAKGIAGTPYIDVTLGTDATLTSVTMANLLDDPTLNLFVVTTATGDKFLRYQTAQLIDVNKWRLTGIMYNAPYAPAFDTLGDIAVNDKCAFYRNVPHTLTITDQEVGKTLHMKPGSFNFRGDGQTLSDVTAVQQTIAGLHIKPLPPCNIVVGGFAVDASRAVTLELPADIAVSFASRNRRMIGSTVDTDTTAVREDAEFSTFRIEVKNGATVRRTVDQTGKTWTYTSANQSSDGVTYPFTLTLQQINTNAASDIASITVNDNA